MKRNFKYKNCIICGRRFKPTSGVQKYCKACGYEISVKTRKEAKHRWYEKVKKQIKENADKTPNKVKEKPKNVKALYDEDVTGIIQAIYRINSIWCAISVIAMVVAIIAIVL